MTILIAIYAIAAVASFVQSALEQVYSPFDTDPLHVKFGVAVLIGLLWPVRLFSKL